jgi:hypothetical protein
LQPDSIAAAGVAMVEEMRTLAKKRNPLTVDKLINLAKETERKWESFCRQVPGAKAGGIKMLILKIFPVLEDTDYNETRQDDCVEVATSPEGSKVAD